MLWNENNNIILQRKQSNMPKENLSLIINNTYPQINWIYYSSLDKLIQVISWIKKLKSNWLLWKRGDQTREIFDIITIAEFQDSHNKLILILKNTSCKEKISNLNQKKYFNSRMHKIFSQFYCMKRVLRDPKKEMLN